MTAPTPGRLPILTFHAIDDADRSAIVYSPAGFTRLLETLDRAGARVLSLMDAVEFVRGRARVPQRSVVLTFDDGYRSVYEAAFPILQRLELTATVFLTVGRGPAGTDDALPSMNGRPMLRWREIRAMHKSGISFGAHTLTHPDLTTLTEQRMREETGESKARIEDALGAPVTSFAYPYGAVNEQTRVVVAERFACACTDRLGMVTPRSDPLALERVEAYYLRDVPAAGMIFTPLFPWYLRARDLPRRARRRIERGGRTQRRSIPRGERQPVCRGGTV